jgi:hypothetical protein
MSRPDYCWTWEEEGTDIDECTGNPYECQCRRCREWLIDVKADREYDERKEAA